MRTEQNLIRAPLLIQLLEDPTIDNKPVYLRAEEYYEDICRSLESLLNTKRSLICEYIQDEDLKHASIGYGIPDYTNDIANNANRQFELCNAVQRAIEYFEPRLTNINVQWADEFDQAERIIKLIIYASLVLNNEHHAVSFESTADSMLKHFKVQ